MIETKIPRLFGRNVVSAYICGKVNQKIQELPVFLTIGHNEIEVYSDDWGKCYHSFQLSESKAEVIKDQYIHIVYSRNLKESKQSIECVLKYEKPEIIVSAFSNSRKNENIQKLPEIGFNQILSFSCGIQKPILIDKFKHYLEMHARKRLSFFSNSYKLSNGAIKAIAIEFKTIFPSVDPKNWDEAFEALWYEFIGFVAILYYECLKLSIDKINGPNSFEYFSRLTLYISEILAKCADTFNIERNEFLESIRNFLDGKKDNNLQTISYILVGNIGLALGRIRKRWPIQCRNLSGFAQYISVAIELGESIKPDLKEADDLASLLSIWGLSLVNNTIPMPSLNSFKNSIELLAIAGLKANEDKRYDPSFHLVLALWKLSLYFQVSN